MATGLNIVTAAFTSGMRSAKTHPLWQYDYGQILNIAGLSLPDTWEAHFANAPNAESSGLSIGTGNQVLIPDVYFETGKTIYCWIFLHEGADDGETEYSITIPVNARPLPTDIEPAPEEQSVIEQLMGALTAAAEKAETEADNAENSALAAAGSAASAEAYAEQASASASSAAGSAGSAETEAQAASASAYAAAGSAQAAGQSAQAAAQSAEDSAASAAEADTSADRAEQAATEAGYMFFQIDAAGHLIFERTPQVSAEFSINPSGHLILGGV